MPNYEIADTDTDGDRTWTVIGSDGTVIVSYLTEDEAELLALVLNSDCQAVTV